MYSNYMECVAEAGGVPVILPLMDGCDIVNEIAERFDGFLFAGGPDIDPVIYSLKRHELCEEPSKERDRCEKALFEKVVKTSKPIMGICRGHQFINVMCGGTLYQDITDEADPNIHHRMDEPYNRVAHKVSIYPDTPLYKLLKEKEIGVNSCHHQAICELAPCLDPMALSPDGFVESFYMPGMRYLQGYQWHPEKFAEDENSKKIFSGFIKACKESICARNKQAKF